MIFHPYDLLLSTVLRGDRNGSFFRERFRKRGFSYSNRSMPGNPGAYSERFCPIMPKLHAPVVGPAAGGEHNPTFVKSPHQRWRHADFPASG